MYSELVLLLVLFKSTNLTTSEEVKVKKKPSKLCWPQKVAFKRHRLHLQLVAKCGKYFE